MLKQMYRCVFKSEEKRKVALRMGENVTVIDIALINKRTPTVYAKCEGSPWGVSARISGSRYK